MLEHKPKDKWIADIVGTFCDPIIVMPGGWGDSLPEHLKKQVTIERLIENIRAAREGNPTATDAEAACYLFTASLTAPMGADWCQIYLYVAGKVMTKSKDLKMPEDICVETLTPQQERKLADLKRFIYESRLKHRKERHRLDALAKETKPAVVSEQLALDLD